MAASSKSKVCKVKTKQKGKGGVALAASLKKKVVKVVSKPASVAVELNIVKPAMLSQNDKKKVSQKLLETIEKRKQAAGNGGPGRPAMFGKPPGRRGRRPKGSVEYTPEHREEEAYVLESEYESIEYDTGIRVKTGREEGFGLDRVEDFDEELNFDW